MLLIRHAHTDAIADGRADEHWGITLSGVGIVEAEELGRGQQLGVHTCDDLVEIDMATASTSAVAVSPGGGGSCSSIARCPPSLANDPARLEDRGELVAEGNHESLLATSELYQQLAAQLTK